MASGKQNRPVTDEEREQVRKLHGEGLSRNQIAKRLGRSSRTVSLIAEALEPPITFDRTKTAVATEARKIDARARRAALIHRAYSRAEKLYDRLEADETSGYQFTATTVHGISTRTLNHVPAQDEKALATAAGQYLAQAARLEALDTDSGTDAARSMLTSLADGIRRLADAQGDDAEEG